MGHFVANTVDTSARLPGNSKSRGKAMSPDPTQVQQVAESSDTGCLNASPDFIPDEDGWDTDGDFHDYDHSNKPAADQSSDMDDPGDGFGMDELEVEQNGILHGSTSNHDDPADQSDSDSSSYSSSSSDSDASRDAYEVSPPRSPSQTPPTNTSPL